MQAAVRRGTRWARSASFAWRCVAVNSNLHLLRDKSIDVLRQCRHEMIHIPMQRFLDGLTVG